MERNFSLMIHIVLQELVMRKQPDYSNWMLRTG